MRGIIDRFEDEFAVVEFDNKAMRNIPRTVLEPGAKAGDVIVLEGDRYKVDEAETLKRKTEIAKLTENLWD